MARLRANWNLGNPCRQIPGKEADEVYCVVLLSDLCLPYGRSPSPVVVLPTDTYEGSGEPDGALRRWKNLLVNRLNLLQVHKTPNLEVDK